jgi:hypothetical protein
MAPKIKVRVKRKLPKVSGAYDLWIERNVRGLWRSIPIGIARDLDEAIEQALQCLPKDANGLCQWEYLHDGVLYWEARGRYARITARILDN